MYYLRIENSSFSVLRSDWMEMLGDTVRDTDIPITEEDYNKYSKLCNNAKQFRIRETPTGAGLFDYIEECEPEPIVVPKSETEKLKEEIVSLKETIAEIVESSNISVTNTKEGVTDLNEMVDTSTN